MQRVSLISPSLRILLLSRKVLFEDEFPVVYQQKAVNVFVCVLPDPFDQLFDQRHVEVLAAQISRRPPGFFVVLERSTDIPRHR